MLPVQQHLSSSFCIQTSLFERSMLGATFMHPLIKGTGAVPDVERMRSCPLKSSLPCAFIPFSPLPSGERFSFHNLTALGKSHASSNTLRLRVSRSRAAWTRCTAPTLNPTLIKMNQVQRRVARVLILGGTGRAGAHTAWALAHMVETPTSITIAGRNEARGRAVVDKIGEHDVNNLVSAKFEAVDIGNSKSLHSIVGEHDLIVHTAGPFQKRAQPSEVLRAAIILGKDYVDICDDVEHAQSSRKLMQYAKENDVRAVICAGIYPGISNMAAAEAVSQMPGQNADSIELFYYTAGSGGIGATVLASTFLILSERALLYSNGQKVLAPPAGDKEMVDFGGKTGARLTYLLNLPEVASLYETVLAPKGGGSITAKFSTSPGIWNWLLQCMAKVMPKRLMAHRDLMNAFAKFSIPVVRFVDHFSGARTAFMIKITGKPESGTAEKSRRTIYYEHECLAKSIGDAAAAFVIEMLKDLSREQRQFEKGVFYPEELHTEIRKRICNNAVQTAERFEIA